MDLKLAASVALHAPLALFEVIKTQALEHTIARRRLASRGAACYIPNSVSFRFPERIALGARVTLGPYDRVWASQNATIAIGDDALFGPGVTILTATHGSDDPSVPIVEQPALERAVWIGAGAWLGANAVVMPGVRIGAGAVVGANAVVTRDVAPGEIVAGVPAHSLRARAGVGS